jgi:hypothetical protein
MKRSVSFNQRPPAVRGPGPFEGPASYPQLCWWSLVLGILVILDQFSHLFVMQYLPVATKG